jgi:hypothetical protein
MWSWSSFAATPALFQVGDLLLVVSQLFIALGQLLMGAFPPQGPTRKGVSTLQATRWSTMVSNTLMIAVSIKSLRFLDQLRIPFASLAQDFHAIVASFRGDVDLPCFGTFQARRSDWAKPFGRHSSTATIAQYLIQYLLLDCDAM